MERRTPTERQRKGQAEGRRKAGRRGRGVERQREDNREAKGEMDGVSAFQGSALVVDFRLRGEIPPTERKIVLFLGHL